MKQIQSILDILKNATTIQCHTLEDDMDIMVDYFNPNVEHDPEIPEMVIAGELGAIFTDDLENAIVENNTIKTRDYLIQLL
jgi:hypothetical protein